MTLHIPMRDGTAMRRAVALLGAVALGACGGGADTAPAFSPSEVISASSGVGAAPMFAVAQDGREATAWVSAEGGGSDGRLHVRVSGAGETTIADPLGPIEPHGESPPKRAWAADGSLHALYVVSRVVPGRRFPQGALRHMRSADGGASWSAPVTVTDDTLVFGSHNFHALHAAADGSVIAAWLDGRAGQSAAFLARSLDGGTTWGRNTRLGTGEACPCCRTAIATAADGSMWVAWRAVMPGNVRDIVVAHSTDRGATFGEAKRVHADDWVFEACPHAGPSMLTDVQGRLHIAWWTGKEGRSGVWYSRLEDDGAFREPMALSAMGSLRPVHVQLAIEGNDIVAAWDDATTTTPRVIVRVSRDGGSSFGASQVISGLNEAATFPVVGLANGEITVAWTRKAAEEHEHDEQARPDMRDPKSVMGLKEVGQAAVIVRRAKLSGAMP